MENDFLARILVPVDDSVSSLMAQETAAMIAKKSGAVVTVLHVIPDFRSAYDYPLGVRTEILSNFEKRSQAILSKASALFIDEKVAVNVEVRRGDPAATIIDFSIHDFDLIIMGACGEHETDLCKLGSVTKKVVRSSHRPLLVVKKVNPLSNFLVCTDGSGHSIEALIFGIKLAKKLEAKVTLLNVQEEHIQAASPKTAAETGELVLSATLDAVAEETLEVSKRLEFGTPSNVITDVAEEGKFDLVILGSRGLGTAERFLLGSISDDVSYNAKCSILIVPPKAGR